MAVFRVKKINNFTICDNYHLRDLNISLKAKGLLSQMLSLPEGWDYTLAGLSKINKESVTAIRSGIKELEAAGYLVRRQTTDSNGKFAANEYTIYERPLSENPVFESKSIEALPDLPVSEDIQAPAEVSEPLLQNPTTEVPTAEISTQINIDKSNTEKTNTESIPSTPSRSGNHSAKTGRKTRRTRSEVITSEEFKNCREVIEKHIDYDVLTTEGHNPELLNEIVGLVTETVCAPRTSIRVAKADLPAPVVKSRLMTLTGDHIRYVMDNFAANAAPVRNMKAYLLTSLWNAPISMHNHYQNRVNHDLKPCNTRYSAPMRRELDADELASIRQMMSA